MSVGFNFTNEDYDDLYFVLGENAREELLKLMEIELDLYIEHRERRWASLSKEEQKANKIIGDIIRKEMGYD